MPTTTHVTSTGWGLCVLIPANLTLRSNHTELLVSEKFLNSANSGDYIWWGTRHHVCVQSFTVIVYFEPRKCFVPFVVLSQ